jgi:hypothetical protein
LRFSHLPVACRMGHQQIHSFLLVRCPTLELFPEYFMDFLFKNKLLSVKGEANRMNHVSEFPDLTHRRSHTLQSFATWLFGSRNFCPNQSGSLDMKSGRMWMSKLKESGPIG